MKHLRASTYLLLLPLLVLAALFVSPGTAEAHGSSSARSTITYQGGTDVSGWSRTSTGENVLEIDVVVAVFSIRVNPLDFNTIRLEALRTDADFNDDYNSLRAADVSMTLSRCYGTGGVHAYFDVHGQATPPFFRIHARLWLSSSVAETTQIVCRL